MPYADGPPNRVETRVAAAEVLQQKYPDIAEFARKLRERFGGGVRLCFVEDLETGFTIGKRPDYLDSE